MEESISRIAGIAKIARIDDPKIEDRNAKRFAAPEKRRKLVRGYQRH
jgi:hypothetical protein